MKLKLKYCVFVDKKAEIFLIILYLFPFTRRNNNNS